MHKRPLAVIAIFFIFGIVSARFLPVWVGFTHVFIATLVFILASFTGQCRGKKEIASSFQPSVGTPRNDSVKNIFLSLSVVSFAMLLYINSNIFPNNHISHFLGEEKLKTTVVGVIKSPALTRKPYYGKISSTYLFEVEQIKDRNVQGLAQIRIETEKDYQYGDRLVVKGTIRKPGSVVAKFTLPTGALGRASSAATQRKKPSFNYRKYLERQNIFALVNTKEANVTILARNYKSNPILKYTYLLREKLKKQIIKKMPLESGAFLRAILLGDRSELPKDIHVSFKNSGTMHILPAQNTKKLNYSS